jgi:hypothetical protein
MNSGMMTVVRAWRLRAMLEEPIVQAKLHDAEMQLGEQLGPPAVLPT